MDYFTAIRLFSVFELCLFGALLVAAIAGHDGASTVLGWSHGVGWILLCVLVARGKSRTARCASPCSPGR